MFQCLVCRRIIASRRIDSRRNDCKSENLVGDILFWEEEFVQHAVREQHCSFMAIVGCVCNCQICFKPFYPGLLSLTNGGSIAKWVEWWQINLNRHRWRLQVFICRFLPSLPLFYLRCAWIDIMLGHSISHHEAHHAHQIVLLLYQSHDQYPCSIIMYNGDTIQRHTIQSFHKKFLKRIYPMYEWFNA